jgi:Zn-dependent protease with chaperone function
MGIYLTYSKKEEIVEEIHKFIDENGYEETYEENEENKHTVKARGEVASTLFGIFWEVENYGSSSSIRIITSLNKNSQILLGTEMFILSVLFFVVFSMGMKILSSSSAHLPLNNNFFYVLCLLSVLLGLIILKEIRKMDSLKRIEANFIIYIRRKIDIKSETPVSGNMLSPVFLLIYYIYVFVISTYLVIHYDVLLLEIAIMIIFYDAIKNITMNYFGRKEKYFIWKIILTFYVLRWTISTYSLIFILMMLIVLNSMVSTKYENIVQGKEVPYKEILSLSYNYNEIKFQEEKNEDPVRIHTNMIESIISKKNETNKKEGEGISQYNDEKKRSDEKIINILMFPILFAIIFFIISIRHVYKIPNDWKLMLPNSSAFGLKPPSMKLKYKGIFYILHVLLVIIFSPLNYIYSIISVDIVSYVIFNKTIILKEMSILLSWIPTMCGLYADKHYPGQQMLFAALAKGILIIFAFPFIYLISRSMLNILKKKKNEDNKVMNAALPTSMSENINKISSNYNIKVPIIKIIENNELAINSEIGLFSRRATITISRNILQELGEKEIMATLAHELYHIKHDLKNIKLLKILSRILLYPNFMLTILLDYRRMEEMADRFAIRVTENKEDIKSALIKMDVISSLKKETVQGKKYNILREINNKMRALDEFLFGEALIGYSHPEILERLAQIEMV